MSIERDYLLRQLQAFAQALAEAIVLRHQGKILEALYLLDDLISTDRDALALVDLPLDQFVARIDFMQDFDTSKSALLAEALDEKATLLDQLGQVDVANTYKIKAMHLALEVLLSDPETYRQTTHDIVARLGQTIRLGALPAATALLLQEFAAGQN
jgi:phosphoglycerate-specific signal transduction histidine kinase